MIKLCSSLVALAMVISCSKTQEAPQTTVSHLQTGVNLVLGNTQDDVKFQVLSEDMLPQKSFKMKSGSPLNKMRAGLKTAGRTADVVVEDNIPSLKVGFPIGLIGQEAIFGGVITKVSDKQSELLGGLKLTDLSPVHIRPVLNRNTEGNLVLTLVGCFNDCDETSPQGALVDLPIVGEDPEKETALLDLSALGTELNLIALLDPAGSYTKLKTISANVTQVEYSMPTLAFDVTTRLIPVDREATDTTAPVTEFTARWYIKLSSGFNPMFKSRAPTEGVGYFTTERSKEPKITRFSIHDMNMVHYYVKHVPAKYQPIFAGAFDKWNVEFQKIIGRALLSYEFIPEGDPRNDTIVAGDIRYNVLEWDLNNRASYGGLGPSIANQFTGETISANVLIQGPKIIEMYTKWFAHSETANQLIADGNQVAADKLMRKFNLEANKEFARENVVFKLKLGKKLEMTIHSQRKELEDPAFKGHFEIVPTGVTFDQYMEGYFSEMLDHELGHNLGLRHNFKGNLGSFETRIPGSVSRSIMEYMGRPYRFLNIIGPYDRMAIAFGYKGVAPKELTWFCTDENEASTPASLLLMSAECSKNDATNDPYTFWETRLSRALDMAMNRKSIEAPIWKVSELTELMDAVKGLSNYALGAEKTAHTWTNFFGRLDRPADKSGMKDYVMNSFNVQFCAKSLDEVVGGKATAEAQKLTQDNLTDLRATVSKRLAEYGLPKLNCQ